MDNRTFVFKGYDNKIEEGEIAFYYSIIGSSETLNFKEKISLPAADTANIPENLIKSLLDSILLILGISYWKTYCPKNIELNNLKLTKDQASFWNTVYTKGLGEFFYKNKINFKGLVQFPYDENVSFSPAPFSRKERSLLPLGGGKDSIVSAELLKEQNKPFDILTVGTSQIQEEVAEVMGKKPIVIKRKLDPQLFELNKQKDTYNGHIPISAVYAFLGLLSAVLYDYNSVVVGNEKSANYGNVEYLGEVINHQWSKSEEFEKLFVDYIAKFVKADVSYSSPLRNMSELEVTSEFVKHKQYFKVFSSCNTNFKINNPSGSAEDHRWCGKCAKCLFVFIMLSAFIPKNEVLDIFGKNLLDDQTLLPLLEQLLGLRDIKPFECVGTPDEVKEALVKTSEKGEFENSLLMNYFQKL